MYTPKTEKERTAMWGVFDPRSEHEIGNEDCNGCNVTEKCECGGILHIYDMVDLDSRDWCAEVMCDKCGKTYDM